jgi:NADH-quinone oxidoreductase subunit J
MTIISYASYIFFFILAAIALGSALGMLTSRNAIYSALFLVLNFATVAVFYLTLHAPFLAIVQVSVYAGAIMVLFLFVIMLLGAERLGAPQALPWQRPLAIVLGVLLVAETAYLLLSQLGALPQPIELTDTFGTPGVVGQALYTNYLLPFEITSVLLLVAMIGAIVLTRDDKKKSAPAKPETNAKG